MNIKKDATLAILEYAPDPRLSCWSVWMELADSFSYSSHYYCNHSPGPLVPRLRHLQAIWSDAIVDSKRSHSFFHHFISYIANPHQNLSDDFLKIKYLYFVSNIICIKIFIILNIYIQNIYLSRYFKW